MPLISDGTLRQPLRSCDLRQLLCLVAQSGPILCGPMECNPPGSSVRGIIPARILEWVAISYSRESLGIKPMSPALQVDSLPLSHLGFLSSW